MTELSAYWFAAAAAGQREESGETALPPAETPAQSGNGPLQPGSEPQQGGEEERQTPSGQNGDAQEEAPPPAQSAAQSGEERPDSLLEGEVIDLNTADEYDLQRLPGIGEKRAQAIVAYRAEHGPFQSVDELDRVEGIGEGILAGLREYVTVGGAEG